MNGKEFNQAVAEDSGVDLATVKKVMASCFSVKARTLAAGEDVTITGEGKLSVEDRAGRMARNPRTGEAISVPAKKVVKFTAQKALLEAIGI